MVDVFNLGNVLQQAETIKGQRLANQGRTLQNQLLGQKQQGNVLLENFLAGGGGVGSEGFNQLSVPQQQSLINVRQGQQDINVVEQQQKKEAALVAVRGADAIIKSNSPKSLLINGFPPLVEQLKKNGVNVEELTDDEVIQIMTEIKIKSSPIAGIGIGGAKGTGQIEFEADIADLSPAEKRKARDIKLKLRKGAGVEAAARVFDIGGVPHILNAQGKAERVEVSGEEITTKVVAQTKAEISQATKFGELTGSSRAKRIDTGFETIQGLEENNRNIDLGINALRTGAKSGFIQQFLPTIRKDSIKLANVRNRLGLDVIGSVRFGALSEGERAMATETAIPTTLEPPQLIEWLEAKKIANNKMLVYFNEQIQFLDQGGTIAGFLRQKSQQTQDTGLPEGARVLTTLASGARVIELADGSRKVLE